MRLRSASLFPALSVTWTQARRRNHSLLDIARWLSAAPAQLAGLSADLGSIAPGKHASLVAFDPEATFTVTPDVLHYRHKISPYMGETLHGVVRRTWLRGTPVYTHHDHPVFPVTPHGREHKVSCLLSSI